MGDIFDIRDHPDFVGGEGDLSAEDLKDKRTWWRRLLFRARSSDYLCLRFEKYLVTHPVTEEKTYLSNSLSIPGSSLFTSERYHRCEEVNPDGHCREFQTSRK